MVPILLLNGLFSFLKRTIPLLLLSSTVIAQNLHEQTWFFGSGHTVNFSGGAPVVGGIPDPVGHQLYQVHSGGTPRAQIAVSDDAGALQFFMQIIFATGTNNYAHYPKVFDKNGDPFPNGNIFFSHNDYGAGNPLVVPDASKRGTYYLFYVKNNSLFYSLVDMSLNNGLGDVVTNEKDIQLTNYGTVLGHKMTTVPGCNCLWLIIRSCVANEYFSFKIDAQGVNTSPFISITGTMPLPEYNVLHKSWYGGVLRSSISGRYLVAGTNKGIELYDFEPCSGRVYNARMLDTLPVYGLCFSPDDSKLYSTELTRQYNIQRGLSVEIQQGIVQQYDFNKTGLKAILASKALILENPLAYDPMEGVAYSSWLGDLKRGPDGKIYVANNFRYKSRHPYLPVFPATTISIHQTLHVIHQPNLSGLSCNPELDYLELVGPCQAQSGFMLPQEIKIVPHEIPDTLPGTLTQATVCFAPTHQLQANPDGACYLWDDGSSASSRVVKGSGTYWVRYFQGCSIRTDTFKVRFVLLPDIPTLYHGCEENITVKIPPVVDDSTLYQYTLQQEQGPVVWTASSNKGHAFVGLHSGSYTLRITAAGLCDTTITLLLNAFPNPTITTSPQDTIIRYGDSLMLQATGAERYIWRPGTTLNATHTPNPVARPLQPIVYSVLGTDAYGCSNLGYVKVNIDYTMPEFMPNAFSPNGDGINDVYRIMGISYQQLAAFSIYNRYGRAIFTTTHVQTGWDGTYKGQPCDAGTYYYQVQLLYPDGNIKTYKGDLMLIR